jgi:hypothetical protein
MSNSDFSDWKKKKQAICIIVGIGAAMWIGGICTMVLASTNLKPLLELGFVTVLFGIVICICAVVYCVL